MKNSMALVVVEIVVVGTRVAVAVTVDAAKVVVVKADTRDPTEMDPDVSRPPAIKYPANLRLLEIKHLETKHPVTEPKMALVGMAEGVIAMGSP